MMASSRFRRLWLITCLALLGGLATAVPVNCLCEADQHWGQAVHPIFEHYHGDGHGHRATDETESRGLAHSDSGATSIVSEHGSLLGVAIDGLLFGRTNVWLALGMIPLLTLLPSSRRAFSAAILAPPTGPPRARTLFS
jgi:hypothetical protein